MQGFSSILIVMIFLMLLGFGAIISKFNLKIRSLLPLIFLPILLYWVYLESSYLVRVLEGAELLDGGAMMGMILLQIPIFILMSPALISFSVGIEIFKEKWGENALALMLASIGISFIVSSPYLLYSSNSDILLSAIILGSLSVAIQLGMRRYRRIKE